MINTSFFPKAASAPKSLSQFNSKVAEDSSGPIESFVSGAASAVMGAAILGGSTLISAVHHYPKHAG